MVLETLIKPKRFFNEKSKDDINMAKQFFTHHRWGFDGCPFILEYPYLTIPDMIKDKMIHKTLGINFDRRHHWGCDV
jgi:hypothetical protein